MEGALAVFLLLIFILGTSQGAYNLDRPKPKCAITRTFRMLTADCHGLNLEAIPQDMHTDIEVLVVSFNRLRKLTASSFIQYPSLKMIYLEDNLITEIEEGTFATLTELEVLNISLNGLNTIPIELMYLPKLRKIYIDHNKLDDSSFEKMQEGVFTISYLSMSKCGLTALPSLKIFPELYSLNMSGNLLTTIEPLLISHACNLQELDLNYNPKLFKNSLCECQEFEHYLTAKNIKLTAPYALNCSQIKSTENECGNLTVSPEAEEFFNSCIAHQLMILKTAEMRQMWLAIGITIGVVIVLVIIVLTYLYRRNRAKQLQKNNNLNKGVPEDEPEATLIDRSFNIAV